MARKTSEMATTGEQAMTRYELPARVESQIPENSVSAEELCNAGDIVLRGVGKPIKTEMGWVRPVYFQNVDQYQEQGPAPVGCTYYDGGADLATPIELHELLCLTIKSNDPAENGGVYQFITSHKSPVIRVAQQVTADVLEGVDDGKLAALRQKVSIANPGQRYYYFE